MEERIEKLSNQVEFLMTSFRGANNLERSKVEHGNEQRRMGKEIEDLKEEIRFLNKHKQNALMKALKENAALKQKIKMVEEDNKKLKTRLADGIKQGSGGVRKGNDDPGHKETEAQPDAENSGYAADKQEKIITI